MKKRSIPQFTLPEIAAWNGLSETEQTDYNLSTVEPGYTTLQGFPYRVTFYGLGICKEGSIALNAGLDSYKITPRSLIIMGPEVVRSWHQQSTDYLNNALFFTEEFLLEDNLNSTLLRKFNVLKPGAPKVWQLGIQEADRIWQLLQEIKKLGESKRKNDIVRAYLIIILNIVADNFDLYNPSVISLMNDLVESFKRSISENYMTLRLVSDYAKLLNITSKHLSETVKTETGKTAGQWIDDMLILEAKVMLKQTGLNISQIAQHMNFSDVSAFGKFFRRHAGMSPITYRELTQAK